MSDVPDIVASKVLRLPENDKASGCWVTVTLISFFYSKVTYSAKMAKDKNFGRSLSGVEVTDHTVYSSASTNEIPLIVMSNFSEFTR